MSSIYKLENPIQEYPWGSTTLMPKLLGRENPQNTPFAEMWMGVHSRGPSLVKTEEGRKSLSAIIASDPEDVLGEEAAERFHGSLPFLFKVLAAGEPLSIQAHPNKEQAEAGYAREEQEGLSIDAFNRSYRDRNHKPEILCALTPFTAMCGFRDPDEILDNFSPVNASSVVSAKLLPALAGKGASQEKRLETFFHRLMSLQEEETRELVKELLNWAEKDGSEEARLVRRFHDLHGPDRGVAAPLYLNVRTLERGEALFQPAGVLHAYVEGMGVELMANSDNVLRGGLTKKHVDVGELLSILSFSPRKPDVIQPHELEPGLEEYPAPIDEFLLRRIRPASASGTGLLLEGRSSVEIGLCVEGELSIEPVEGIDASSSSKTILEKGESVVLPYGVGDYRVSGEGELYLATIPLKD